MRTNVARNVFGPDKTPHVRTLTGDDLRRARGRDRPTHFSRTQSGASPGGIEVTCRRRGIAFWGLTFDMSGGAKGAKRPLGRPPGGGVRCQRCNSPHGVVTRDQGSRQPRS